MARNNQRGGTTTRRAPKDLGRRVKKKPCALCRDRTEWVDYKDVPMLRKYMSDRGKIRSRRVTGNCAQHQRALAMAIKTARELVLLPYTQRTVTERPGGRGGGRDRGDRGERGERAERTLSDTTEAEAPRNRDADIEVLTEIAAAGTPEAAPVDVAPAGEIDIVTEDIVTEAGVISEIDVIEVDVIEVDGPSVADGTTQDGDQ
jgi:small subunit ribosomal protein S18